MKKKRAAASASKAGKAAKKKTVVKRRKLRKPTIRQTNLIAGLLAGKSTRKAALEAGYSERMAEHATELLSSEALRGFCQRRLSLDKVLDRIDEGLDAEETEVIITGRKGEEDVQITRAPNYGERRQAAALAARLIGADPTGKVEVSGSVAHEMKVTWVNVDAIDAP